MLRLFTYLILLCVSQICQLTFCSLRLLFVGCFVAALLLLSTERLVAEEGQSHKWPMRRTINCSCSNGCQKMQSICSQRPAHIPLSMQAFVSATNSTLRSVYLSISVCLSFSLSVCLCFCLLSDPCNKQQSLSVSLSSLDDVVLVDLSSACRPDSTFKHLSG